jgi:hypothetical protein
MNLKVQIKQHAKPGLILKKQLLKSINTNINFHIPWVNNINIAVLIGEGLHTWFTRVSINFTGPVSTEF